MIKRVRDYGRKAPSRDSHKIYIVCEGKETEPAYFAFFQGLSHNLEIISIPPGCGTDPLKLIENAKEQLINENRKYSLDHVEGDTVWFVFDTDTWEKEGKIEPLHDFCQTQNKEIPEKFSEVKFYKAWNYAQSNPCFEIWQYYHIFSEKPDAEAVAECNSFKEFVNKAITGGFNAQSHPVFLEDAISNADKNSERGEDGKLCLYSTEMAILGREILPFVKKELDRLRNKLK